MCHFITASCILHWHKAGGRCGRTSHTLRKKVCEHSTHCNISPLWSTMAWPQASSNLYGAPWHGLRHPLILCHSVSTLLPTSQSECRDEILGLWEGKRTRVCLSGKQRYLNWSYLGEVYKSQCELRMGLLREGQV